MTSVLRKEYQGKFSAPRTPQQNRVIERKNRTLVEAARTMLSESRLPMYFWAEVVNTACYTQNRTLINKDHEKDSLSYYGQQNTNSELLSRVWWKMLSY